MTRYRIWLRSLVSLAAVAGLAACAGAGRTATAVPTQTLTDDIGNPVVIAGPVQRIVSLAPSNTEIVFALGLGDRLVGVTDFCDYPPEALEIPKIGGVEPNVEEIVALDPDLVLAIGGEPNPPVIGRLRELGLTVLTLKPHDLEQLYNDILLVGQATAAQERAQELVAQMRERVATVTAATAEVTQRPLVYYELDATDIARPWTAGPGSWHDEFIRLAGGINLAGSQESAWVQMSSEEVIAQNPDIILLGDAAWGITPESVAQRPGWEVIAAVRNGRVYPIDDTLISRPGPRVVEGIEQLAHLIHPELFP